MRRLALVIGLSLACGGRGGTGEDGEGGTEAGTGTGTGTTGTGTGTGTGSETGVVDESGEEGPCGSFLCDGDLMPEVCDPVLQDCPEGEKCTAVGDQPGTCCDSHRCVDVIGDEQLWEPCMRGEDNDDCAPGLFCMTLDQTVTGPGICFGFCPVDDPDGCQSMWALDEAYCAPLYGGVVPVCEKDCHPLDQDCDDGLACMAVFDDGFVCSVPGDGLHAEACASKLGCAKGLLCVNGPAVDGCQSDACCTNFCDITEMNTCEGPNEACIPYWENGMPPPGYENVGVCAIPA